MSDRRILVPLAVLLAALGLGLLLGTLDAAREIWANDWLHYGLHRLVAAALPAAALAWLVRTVAVAAAVYLALAVARRFDSATTADRRSGRLLGAAAGLAVTLAWGFHLNRYTYKELWADRHARSVFGVKLWAAVLTPRVWLANLGVVVAGLVAGWIVYRGLSWWMASGEQRVTRAVVSALATVALVLALPAVAAWLWLDRPAQGALPNIVLVSMDTLRADHLSCFGYPRETSPALDRLALEGVVFENAVTQANWTLPSHMSMMTSQIPSAHGVIVRENRLPRFKVTLAEVLKNAGYRTQGFTGGYYVDSRFGFDQGFDEYRGDRVEYLWQPEKRKYQKGVRFEHLLPSILDWSAAHQRQPFFLFLHAWDTHAPYLPHPAYIDHFSPGYKGGIEMLTHEMVDDYQKTWRQAPPADVERIRALYDNEIRYVDDFLGQLFHGLREQGQVGNTIVVFTSDHGDELFEHGIDHQFALYEPETHVPLILAYPGRVPAGKRVKDMVRTIDVMPTLLALAGVSVSPEVHAELQGQSLIGTWDGVKPAPWSVAEGYRGRQLSLRTNGFKYVRTATEGDPREELYDLDHDPGELTDLHAVSPELTAAMRTELDARLLALRQVRFAGKSEAGDLDAEAIERLKSLGYAN